MKIACILAAAAAVPSARAADFYWDQNGTTAGFGIGTGAWAEDNTSPGPGRWTTSAAGTIAGSLTQTTSNADTFSFGTATNGLGAGTITITGTVDMGNTTYGSASGAIVLTGGTIAFSAAPTVTVNNATNRIESVIGGAATSFTKAGSGILVLTGANTFTGTTVISNGTLNLGGGTANGSLASTVLTLGGGALNYTRTGSTTQSFTTTNINSGGSAQLSVVAGNTLNLGTVSRAAGATLDFGAVGAGTVAALAASNDASGIMPGFTFGNSWAVANGAGVAISGFGSYTLTSVAGTTAANYAGLNIDVDNNAGALDAPIAANSLRFSAAGTNSITLTGTTNVITSGGILVGSGVGSNLSTITGGTLAGAASKDLSVIQNNTAGGLTISSVIGNNTGATALAKSGGGLLTLGASNTFTGGVFIHGGTVALGNAGALNSNAVTFGPASTGTLALAGNSVVVANLSTNANPGTTFVQNANGSSVANATLTVGNASNLSGIYAGTIRDGTGGGTLSLTKAGTGTLTLSGANTYSGGTTLTAGVVTISNATSFGSGSIAVTGSSRINAAGGITYANAINVSSGQTLTMQNPAVGSASTATFSGVLSGSGIISLPNTGSGGIQGIIAFTNTANTFTGNVVLSASGAGDEHFQFNSIGDGGNFTFAKNGNRQLITYTGSSNIPFNTRQIVVASTMLNGGTTDRQGMDGGGSFPVSMFANDGTGTVTFASGNNMVVNNIASNYGILYFGGSNTGNNTFAGTISDTSGASQLSIGKFGSGTWIFSGSNTYEGNTLIGGGTLSVGTIADAGTAQPLGRGAGVQLGVGNSGAAGTLEYTGGAASTNKQIVIGAPVNTLAQAAAGSVLNNGSGALTFTNSTFNPTSASYIAPGGSTPTGGAVTATRTLTLGGSYTGGTNEIQGVIQNNAAGGPVALTVSGSTWQLSGANTYTGVTTVSGGTLRLGNTAALASSSGITMNTASNALALGTDTAFTTLPPLAGSTVTGATYTIISDRATSGPGLTHAFSTANFGNVTIAFTSGGNVTSGTAGVSFTGISAGAGAAGTVTLAPSTAALTIGTVTSTNATTKTLVLGGTGTGLITGVISNGASVGFNIAKSGTSTWTLSGANTYTGGFTINGGVLQLGSAGALNSTAGSQNAVTFGAASTGTLALAGNSVVIANLSTNATPGTTFVQNANGASVANAMLTVGNSTNASGIFAGTIQDGTGGGTLGLTKAGTGMLTLTGTSTYTGDTNVNAGTLRVNGSLGSTSVLVNNAGRLEGTGTIAGPITVGEVTVGASRGTIAPGNSVGELNTGSETWNSGGAYIWEISAVSGTAGTDWDLLDITGTLTIASTSGAPFQIKLQTPAGTSPGNATGFNVATPYAWTIAQTSGGVLGFVADKFVLDTTGFNALDGDFAVVQSGNNVNITYTPVPEPASIGMLTIAGVGLLARRRRATR